MIQAFKCTNNDCNKVHKDTGNGFQCTCGNKEITPIEVEDNYFEIEGDLEEMATKNNKKWIHMTISFDTLATNEEFSQELQKFVHTKLKTRENISAICMDKEKYNRLEKEKEKVVKEKPQKEAKIWD